MADKPKPHTDKSNDITQTLDDYLSQLEEESQNALNSLMAIQELMHNQLQVEVARLKNKFGEDDPRIKKLPKSLWQSPQSFISLLDAEFEYARIKAAKIDEKEGLIHSRVEDNVAYRKAELTVLVDVVQDTRMMKGKIVDIENKRGISGLMIMLFDKDCKCIEPIEPVITDDGGYYEFSYTVEDFQESSDPADGIIRIMCDETGNTWISFGDGKQGQRLPPGLSSVQATYRCDSGESGSLMITTRKFDGKPVRIPLYIKDCQSSED